MHKSLLAVLIGCLTLSGGPAAAQPSAPQTLALSLSQAIDLALKPGLPGIIRYDEPIALLG